MEEELTVAFHAEDGRVDESEGLAAEVADGRLYAVNSQLVGSGIADDAALAYVLAAGFELRLYQENSFSLPLRFGRG